jgi:hypothetical protein
LETTIVKGNVDVRFAGTRYDLPPESAASVKQPVSATPGGLDILDRLLADANELRRQVRELGTGLGGVAENLAGTRPMLDAAISKDDGALPASSTGTA